MIYRIHGVVHFPQIIVLVIENILRFFIYIYILFSLLIY